MSTEKPYSTHGRQFIPLMWLKSESFDTWQPEVFPQQKKNSSLTVHYAFVTALAILVNIPEKGGLGWSWISTALLIWPWNEASTILSWIELGVMGAVLEIITWVHSPRNHCSSATYLHFESGKGVLIKCMQGHLCPWCPEEEQQQRSNEDEQINHFLMIREINIGIL